MAVGGRDELIEALVQNPELLIGTAETDWVDFKVSLDLASAKAKRDLAADIGSFANASGGVIVVGVATGKAAPNDRSDVAKELRGVRAGSIDPTIVRSIATDRVHPPPMLRTHEYALPLAGEDALVLFAIQVEACSDLDGPVLVDRMDANDERKGSTTSVAWPTRYGDVTIWETPTRIQEQLRASRRFAHVAWPDAPTEIPQAKVVADAQLDDVGGFESWMRRPAYLVQAFPNSGAREIEDFFTSFTTCVEAWRDHRANGFGLGVNTYPLLPAAGDLQRRNDRTALRINRTGVVTFGGLGDPDWLGWGHHPSSHDSLLDSEVRVNAAVLVEGTAELVRFAGEVISPELDFPSWTLRSAGFRLKGPPKLVLRTNSPRHFGSHAAFEPTGESFVASIEGSGDWASDSYRLLKRTFETGWGAAPDPMPYRIGDLINLDEIGASWK